MCGPALAVPLAIAATAVTATGQIVSGIGQANQAAYAAQVAEQNRRIAADQAKDAEANTAIAAQQRYRQLAQTRGAQQAAMAANGVDINFGTATELDRDTVMIGAEDIGQIYKAGNQKVIGLDREGWNYQAEANAQRAKASGAIVNGLFSAAGTALSGASQVAKMKAGMGGG